ncbi:MAG TPA: TonB family protein [Steroidobacteraceae bacterium]|nr:TonB family protein [Steroidobacteraceae bacterium]
MSTESATGIAPAAPNPLAPARDRLTTMLFLAGLFHVIVIIGITFDLGDPFRAEPVPTIEVLLLGGPASPDAENPEAQYLADRTQEGGGTTDDRVRPASPESSRLPVPVEGTPDGDGLERRDPSEVAPTSEVLKSRTDDRALAVRSGADVPAESAETPMALTAATPARFVTSTTDEGLRLRSDDPRELVVAADTRESVIAPYLDAWKRKTERIGTINYPQAARRRSLSGNPVVEVAIRADGSLAEIRIVRSSGHREIDQAALGIVRLATPFDPFPSEVRAQYDVLRVAYEWQFIGERGDSALRMRPEAR